MSENLNDNELDHIKKLELDIVIVVAYGKILPENFLTLDKIILLIFTSLLPKWRGAAPIQERFKIWMRKQGFQL